MKLCNLVKCALSTSAIAIALSTSPAVFASTESLMLVNPSPIYQSTKNVPLKSVLDKVASRSGIEFKLNNSVGDDIVPQNLASPTWEAAIKVLLQDYNYIFVSDKGVLKTVIVTGKSGSGSDPSQVTATVDPLDYEAPIIITPKMGKLPKAYDSYPAGSVMAIDLPMKELMSMSKGKVVPLDTPLGQFNVTHDNSLQESDGSTTFIGHLADEGQGYRMILSQGPAGVMGSVVTPEGNFSIENQNGAMVLINTAKLIHAGYENDTYTPSTSGMGALVPATTAAAIVAANSAATVATTPATTAVLTATQLATNVTTAQTAVTNDQAAVTKAQLAVTTAQALIASTTANAASATAAATAASTALSIALSPTGIFGKAATAANVVGSPLYALKLRASAELAGYNSALSISTNIKYMSVPAQAANVRLIIATYKTLLANIASMQAQFNTLYAAVTAANVQVTVLRSAIAPTAAAAASANVAKTAAMSKLVPAQATLAAAKTKLANDQVTLSAAQAAAKSAGSANVIDIMVEYATDQYTAAYSLQRIAMLVTASNQAYIDSGINATLRLVYTEPTTYPSASSNQGALSALSAGTGVFSGVAATRSKYGADLVLLFHALNASAQGMNCGIAIIGGASGTKLWSTQGFAVISDGTTKDNTGTYCDINTFTHEVGHTMGLAHNRENTTIFGATPYSYAWRNQTGVGGAKFATIMSYGSPMIMYFSTPTLAAKDTKGVIQTCSGQPCGYAASDTARASDQVLTVNGTAPIISQYMPTMVNAAGALGK